MNNNNDAGNKFTDSIYQLAWAAFFGIIVLSMPACAVIERQAMEHENHGDVPRTSEMLSSGAQDPMLYGDRQHAATSVSEDGFYRVSAFSNEFPLPLQKIHTWTLHAETSEGQPLEDAKITVHGLMPQHQHGFPTRVRVTDYLGNGDYRVEGVKFSMPGYWQIRFNIKEQNRRDTVVFEVNL